MCIIVFAHNYHSDYPLVMIANRDEFYNRPTQVLHEWKLEKKIWAGKDLKAGGTWLAVGQDGSVSAVTNYRDLQNIKEDAKSRGDLVVDAVNSRDKREYMNGVKASASEYNGFNLLLRKQERFFHFSNYQGQINELNAGIHGVSNAVLNTPWPKLERLKNSFEKSISTKVDVDSLFELLSDETLAEDQELPDTGVPFELEKALSAICIKTPEYGTVSSAVLLIDKLGKITFEEKTLDVPGKTPGRKKIEI